MYISGNSSLPSRHFKILTNIFFNFDQKFNFTSFTKCKTIENSSQSSNQLIAFASYIYLFFSSSTFRSQQQPELCKLYWKLLLWICEYQLPRFHHFQSAHLHHFESKIFLSRLWRVYRRPCPNSACLVWLTIWSPGLRSLFIDTFRISHLLNISKRSNNTHCPTLKERRHRLFPVGPGGGWETLKYQYFYERKTDGGWGYWWWWVDGVKTYFNIFNQFQNFP